MPIWVKQVLLYSLFKYSIEAILLNGRFGYHHVTNILHSRFSSMPVIRIRIKSAKALSDAKNI